ncbi:MAG: S49 family peptidase [Verrucomicrobia bacterium]|nr:S49 family peptidase [Verrucomicrobiota bacterium]
MAEGKPGVFKSAIRAFLGTLFGVLGICAGIVVVMIALMSLGSVGRNKDGHVTGRHTVLPGPNWQVEPLKHTSPLILQIDIHGSIGIERLTVEHIREQLVRSQAGAFKGRIQGVLLNISSPGGGAIASDDIYRLVKEYSSYFKIPVYAYADGLCASGGYMIACAADKLYASSSTLIGSVGVLANFMNISGTLEKIGVQSLTLTEGKEKDPLNPLRPWKEGEDKEMKGLIAFYYGRFLDIVTTNRPYLQRKALIEEYGARVFPAPIALEHHYIDGIVENKSHVIELLAQEAGLENYQVVQMESHSWIEQFFQMKSPLITGKLELQLPSSDPSGYCYLYKG